MSIVQVVVAVIVRRDCVLLTRRHDDERPLAGYWEFPGGKVDAGETLEAALHREIREELDIVIVIRAALSVIRHDYPSATIELSPFLCELTRGDARPLAAQSLQWVRYVDLPTYEFPPANMSLLREVITWFESGRESASTAH